MLSMVFTSKTASTYYLVIATGSRYAYDAIPGFTEYAIPFCDSTRILETKKAILDFREGDFYGGVGSGFTPADGPIMEIVMGLDYRLRKLGIRDKARLNFITDKGKLLPPGGADYMEIPRVTFKKRGIKAFLGVETNKLDADYLHFEREPSS